MGHARTRLDLIQQHIPQARRGKLDQSPRLNIMRAALVAVFTLLILGIMTIARPSADVELQKIAGMGALIAIAVSVFVYYIERFQSPYLDNLGRRWLFAVLVLLEVLAGRLLTEFTDSWQWLPLLTPVPLMALVLTVVYDQRFAFDTTLMLFALLFLQAVVFESGEAENTKNFAMMGALVAGSAVTILATRNLRNRTKLLKVGALAGVVMALALSSFILIDFWKPEDWSTWEAFMIASLIVFGHGVMTGIVATSLLPVLERVFNIVTELRLLELEDNNHPLLRMMVERAPGTFMHTQNVARLASEAVDAIGGNALLTRVGTLYHDLGKMVRPEYFTENHPQSKLLHDRLTPAMSGIIILSHVKEGIALARQYKLPRVIEDFITGHHGTSVIGYFYRMAKMEAKEGERIDEGQFRYPGPKPQSREAAVVAIADLVEAAGRAKLDGQQNDSSIGKFVHDSIMHKLQDGQFDECDLTMRDLAKIEESMTKTLASMHHHRVKYPEDPDAKKRKLASLEREQYRKQIAKRREKILTQ